MSIKGFRLLWIKLRVENRRSLIIPFPIPFFIFQELLDCLKDLLTAVCFIVPKVPDSNTTSRITIYSAKVLVIQVMKLLDSLTEDVPYDLADISTGNVRVLIKIS